MNDLSPAELVAELEAQLRPLELELAEAWWESNTKSSPAADERRTTAELARREFLADPTALRRGARRARDAVSPPTTRCSAASSTCSTTASCPTRCRPICAAPSWSSRRASSRPSTTSAARSTVGASTTTRSPRSCAPATTPTTGAPRGRRRSRSGPRSPTGIRELARLRNQAAQALGARDHFALALATGELDEDRLFATLDDVDRATAAPFAEWKQTVDEQLASALRVRATTELRPWHYDDPFFQTPPAEGAVAIDHLFADADLEALTVRTYDGLGLDVRSVLDHSDLYAREGKSQHAFCIDIDRVGRRPRALQRRAERAVDGHDAPRVRARDLRPRVRRARLPWLVRGAAHALTTEGIAMLMGRLPRDPSWLREVGAGRRRRCRRDLAPRWPTRDAPALLVFARWVLGDDELRASASTPIPTPTSTRSGGTWSSSYQLVHRPDGRHAPDWAAKIHLAAAPVYYQNYLYGELFASQLDATLARPRRRARRPRAAGELLVDEVFAPGASLRWDDLVERATGEPLTADAPGAQLVARMTRLMDLGLQGRAAVIAGGTRGVGPRHRRAARRRGRRVAVLARTPKAPTRGGGGAPRRGCRGRHRSGVRPARHRRGRSRVHVPRRALGRVPRAREHRRPGARRRARRPHRRRLARRVRPRRAHDDPHDRAALPLLRKATFARIVNVAASSIRHQSPGLIGFTAAKAAMASASKNLSRRARPRGDHREHRGSGHGDVAHARRLPRRHRPRGPPEGPLEAAYEAIARDYGASNDIGRVGLPEEVATMVVFLCSELCSFVVGATVPVDGGTDFF